MKRIKFLALALVALAFVTSCSNDETKIVEMTFDQANTTVKATVTINRTFTGQGDRLPVSVEFPNSFASNATFDVVAIVNNNTKTEVKSTFTLNSGSTTATGVLNFPAAIAESGTGIPALSKYVSITVEGMKLATPIQGTKYALTSDAVELDFYGKLPNVDNTNVNVLVDFDGAPANDYDLYLADNTNLGAATVVIGSETGTRYEHARVAAAANDTWLNFANAPVPVTVNAGDYKPVVNVWNSAAGNVAYRLFVRTPDNNITVVEGTWTVPAVASGNPQTMFTPNVNINKAVNGANVTFTVTTPAP